MGDGVSSRFQGSLIVCLFFFFSCAITQGQTYEDSRVLLEGAYLETDGDLKETSLPDLLVEGEKIIEEVLIITDASEGTILSLPNQPKFPRQIPQSIEESESGKQNFRRRPINNSPKFKPQFVPLIFPGVDKSKSPSYRISPSITIMNPSGYGASWGNFGLGFGFQSRTRFTNKSDGVIGFGLGFGDGKENLGVQFGVNLTDISEPFRDGTISVKLHRQLTNDFSLALGVQGLVNWGETDGGSSVYGAFTKRIFLQEDPKKLFSEINLSLGVGGGQFRSESDINKAINSVGLFSSLAIRVSEPINLIVEWTGQDLTAGFSYVPFQNIPLVIVPAFTDLTNRAGDGSRFILGIGYSLSF